MMDKWSMGGHFTILAVLAWIGRHVRQIKIRLNGKQIEYQSEKK